MKSSGKDFHKAILGTAAALLAAAALILLCGLSSAPNRNWDEWGRHEKQYEELTDALVHGQLSLLETPAPFLSEMDNPYDPVARSIAAAEHDDYGLIDTAYYNGRYYTYFGPVPALLLFLPVRLITGRMLPTWIAVILMALLCVPAAFFFTDALCRRFFKETGAPLRVLLSLALLLTAEVPYLAAFCTTYSMPAVTGLFFVLTGLGCFFLAEDKVGLHRPLLVAGSVCLSLSVGCRPLFGAAFFLLIPLFSDAIRRGDFFRRRKTALINTAAVLVPAFIAAALLMIYNAARFGNPMEFGLKYLFTTQDLLHGHKSAGEILESMRLLLLSPPDFSTHFPFLEVLEYHGAYQETLYVEPLFGGLIPLHAILPAGLSLFPLVFFTRVLKERALALTSLLTGIVILFTDSVMAGVSQRYEADFALFIFLTVALSFLALSARMENELRAAAMQRFLCVFLALLILADIAVTAMCIFSDGRYFAMCEWNTSVYSRFSDFFN